MRIWLTRFSLKARLVALITLLCMLMVLMVGFALSGMRSSNTDLTHLYYEGLLPSDQVSRLVNEMHQARTQLLLALQHAPGSDYEQAHNHHVSMHFDSVERSVGNSQQLLQTLLAGNLDENERALAEEMQRTVSLYLDRGVRPVMELMRGGDYLKANGLLLDTLQPSFTLAFDKVQAYSDNLHIHAVTAYTSAEKHFDTLLLWLGVVLVLALVLSSALAWATLWGIGQAVNALLYGGKRLADGDLMHRVEYRGRDELGNIADCFNAMADHMQETIRELSKAVEQLAAAAEQTATVSRQTGEGIHRQHLEIDQVATAMNEMSATVQDVASNAASAAHAAEKADSEAELGQQVVTQSIQMIDSLAGEVEHAATVIGELENASATISSVVDVIRGIADQTNLLALNAAIEAARAGEQGRGFAVVADEVRSLASRTQHSTAEIQGMIEKVQGGARRAVEVMEKSCEKAEAGRSQVAEAGRVLQQITAAVATINDMNAMIASAAEEQSSVAEEINRNITNVSGIAEETSDASHQNVETSRELSALANRLHTLVQAFKV
ncbi:methyl-accepting chemotaxis protein [Stutzerimonas stutzeri]|uniref:methyl-accepting chemotaxis protein n=1 Tax=Stutzerimonas stutzeri TaxID=316 RepID=UPI00210B84F8